MGRGKNGEVSSAVRRSDTPLSLAAKAFSDAGIPVEMKPSDEAIRFVITMFQDLDMTTATEEQKVEQQKIIADLGYGNSQEYIMLLLHLREEGYLVEEGFPATPRPTVKALKLVSDGES